MKHSPIIVLIFSIAYLASYLIWKTTLGEFIGIVLWGIVPVIAIWLARKAIYWIEETIVDRSRYSLSQLDSSGGCYRIDKRTGEVTYIDHAAGCMAARVEKENAKELEKLEQELT